MSCILLETRFEFNFGTFSQCFTKVLEGENACLAYGITLSKAISRLSDVYGRPQYITSKDSGFPSTLQLGVSKYYVRLLATLDRIASSLQATGVVFKWLSNEYGRSKEMGKRRARESGKDVNNGQDKRDEGIMMLLAQILAVGIGLATLIYLFELLSGKLSSFLKPVSFRN